MTPLAPDRMRAVLFHGPKDIRLMDVTVPRPAAGEVLLRVGAALTCGTDFKAYRQGHRVLLGDLPAPFGHELAGTVIAAGPGAERFRPGMRVVAANSAPCDRCPFCIRGQSQLCENLKLHNGAYAEYNLVPAHIVRRNLHALPPNLDFMTAALAEPLACALHGVDATRVEAGETAVVVGAGIMARLLIAALRSRGARVLVVGRSRPPLDEVLGLGAEAVVGQGDGDPVAAVRALTEGRGADAVFDAVGLPETWETAMRMTRKGGRA